MNILPLLLAAVAFQPTGERVIRVTDGDKSFLREVPLAELRHAEKEPVSLIRWNPSGWAMVRGTKLAAVRAMECTHPGSVVVSSVKVTTVAGKALDKGRDWEIDPTWGVIGSLDPAITNVLVSYDYRLPAVVRIEADIELIENGWSGRMTTTFLDAPASDKAHHYQTTVLDVKPDLVISEFVNDAAMDEKTFEATYPRILRDFRSIGAEWIIVAPHYVTPSWMGEASMKIDVDPRPFVEWERRFAAENFIALADTPLVWGHLWREGVPYQRFFLNGINHPDHESLGFFVEALMELFRETASID